MINWESGQVIEGEYIDSGLRVNIMNTMYPILMPKIEGETPLSAENLNKIVEGIAPDEYDSTAIYSVGDYCIYNNILYKCITAISIAEAFDSSKWGQTTISEELSNHMNSIYVPDFSWNSAYLVEKPKVYYHQGLIFISAELKTGISGVSLWIVRLTNYKSAIKIISPINSYNSCNGECVVEANSSEIYINVSSAAGNGKAFIIFPAKPIQ